MSLHRAEDDRWSRRRGGSAARGLKAGLLVLGLFALVLPALPAGASTCVSSCTIWNPAVQPTGQMLFNDGIGVELGVMFTASINGVVSGVKFYKDASSTRTPA
jgi:hypothetical protein